MARIWTEQYDPRRHRDPMSDGWGCPRPEGPTRHWRAPTLESHLVLFVRVCGSTLVFHVRYQLEACLDFFRHKLHPSGRLPVYTENYGGDQGETQRWFDRLPMYLREEPKRVQVVRALERALAEYGDKLETS